VGNTQSMKAAGRATYGDADEQKLQNDAPGASAKNCARSKQRAQGKTLAGLTRAILKLLLVLHP
jgi:hypothetical protein